VAQTRRVGQNTNFFFSFPHGRVKDRSTGIVFS
jgi:hypothetical protein